MSTETTGQAPQAEPDDGQILADFTRWANSRGEPGAPTEAVRQDAEIRAVLAAQTDSSRRWAAASAADDRRQMLKGMAIAFPIVVVFIAVLVQLLLWAGVGARPPARQEITPAEQREIAPPAPSR